MLRAFNWLLKAGVHQGLAKRRRVIPLLDVVVERACRERQPSHGIALVVTGFQNGVVIVAPALDSVVDGNQVGVMELIVFAIEIKNVRRPGVAWLPERVLVLLANRLSTGLASQGFHGRNEGQVRGDRSCPGLSP